MDDIIKGTLTKTQRNQVNGYGIYLQVVYLAT